MAVLTRLIYIVGKKGHTYHLQHCCGLPEVSQEMLWRMLAQ